MFILFLSPLRRVEEAICSDERANLVANLLRPDQDLVTAKIACALSQL
jgi:hypothetical protein